MAVTREPGPAPGASATEGVSTLADGALSTAEPTTTAVLAADVPLAAAVADPRPVVGEGERVPALILGGSGYVGGELLRLLFAHPTLSPAIVVSGSHAGEPVEAVFPHLAGAAPGLSFAAVEELPRLLAAHPRVAGFCAAPHGGAATLIEAALAAAHAAGCALPLVDMSADFRFADAAGWERVYGKAHGAPARLPAFARGVPELVAGVPSTLVLTAGAYQMSSVLPAPAKKLS